MIFKDVAELSDIPSGTLKHVEIGDSEILLANVEGKLYAIADRCGHMSASLSMGELKGKIVECTLHGAQFDVTTGKKIKAGHLEGLTGMIISKTQTGKVMAAIRTYDRKSYQVKIDGDTVKVDI